MRGLERVARGSGTVEKLEISIARSIGKSDGALKALFINKLQEPIY